MTTIAAGDPLFTDFDLFGNPAQITASASYQDSTFGPAPVNTGIDLLDGVLNGYFQYKENDIFLSQQEQLAQQQHTLGAYETQQIPNPVPVTQSPPPEEDGSLLLLSALGLLMVVLS